MTDSASSVHYLSKYFSEINSDKILVSYRNTPMILIGNFLGTLPLSIVLWNERNALSIMLWLGMLYSILLFRVIHYQRFNPSQASHDDISRLGREQVLLIFLTGCAWGVAGVLFFDGEEIKNTSLLILTFVSVVASSLVSLSSRPFSYMLFSIPLMIPLIVNMFLQDQLVYNWMGFGSSVYLMATFGFSLTVYRVIDTSLRLKYENLDLIDVLQQETTRANKASEEKSRFLASASHDLRQPLHAVSLYAEILSKKVVGQDQRDDLENIHQGLDSLSELLEALFDVSRLDTDKNVAINKQSFCIDDVLRKLERQFVIDTTLKGLHFSVDWHKYIVYSDPVLLERVLTNLLVNAVKYTETGGINIVFEPAANHHIKLRIVDTGIGISEEDLSCIFQEFFQVHNQERDRKRGLGLGLAIVHRILKLLGHEITVHSVLGGGTEMALLLPLGQEQLSAKPIAVISPDGYSAFEGLSVMVVDNEAVIVTAMESLLSTWGSCSISFSSTTEALDAIHQGLKPDFMIVDYRMPGSHNGCSFVHEARKIVSNVPALIVTGDTSDDVVNEFRRQQLDYLHKPIKPAQLRILVSRILRRHEEQKSALSGDKAR